MSESENEELFDAIQQNDLAKVKHLIEEKGVPLTSINGMDETIAHVAAKNGHLDIVKYVGVKDPSIISLLDFHGESVIFQAIQAKHLEMVKYLVEDQLVDISERHRLWFGNTAIHKAADEGALAILKYFLEERNGDVNIQNTILQTPVFLAAESKHQDVIKYLVEERNANVTSLDYRRCNILYTAVERDDLQLLRYILDERKIVFDIDWKDESDLTLVHRTAILNRLAILKYLVSEKHAHVNIPDKWGKTPLHSAARWNYFELCKYLIENGANVQEKDNEDKLPIAGASEKCLIQLMEKASQTRDRRSVPGKFVPVVPVHFLLKKLTPASRIGKHVFEESPLSGTLSIEPSHVQSFLLFSETIVRRLSKQQSVKSRSIPDVTTRDNGDQFVEDAVRTLPNFIEALRN